MKMKSLRELYVLREAELTTRKSPPPGSDPKVTPRAEAVLDKLAHVAPDFVGDTDEARELIMALVDQAGYPLSVQRRVAELIQLGQQKEEGADRADPTAPEGR